MKFILLLTLTYLKQQATEVALLRIYFNESSCDSCHIHGFPRPRPMQTKTSLWSIRQHRLQVSISSQAPIQIFRNPTWMRRGRMSGNAVGSFPFSLREVFPARVSLVAARMWSARRTRICKVPKSCTVDGRMGFQVSVRLHQVDKFAVLLRVGNWFIWCSSECSFS